MGPLRDTDPEPLRHPHGTAPTVDRPAPGPVPAVPLASAPVTQPTAAELAALVSGAVSPEDRFDPGSWGLLLVPVVVGIGFCLAFWLAF